MKKIIKTILVLLLFVSARAQDARLLKVNFFNQEESLWCWAACSQMILDYYGITVAQCNIAEIARVIDERNHRIHYPNSQTMNHFGTTDCCETYPYNSHCNKQNKMFTTVYSAPGSKGGINTIFDSLNISNTSISSYLTMSEIKNEIDGWKPFIFRWKNYVVEHFVVCRGYAIGNTGASLYTFDPFNDSNEPYPSWPNGPQIFTYDWVVNGLASWTHSLTLSTNPSCGKSDSFFTEPITTSITCTETDYIEISSSINNNVNVDITFGKECILNNGFEIAIGSSITITPNSALICN